MIIPKNILPNNLVFSHTYSRSNQKIGEYGLVVLKPRSHATVYKFDEKQAVDTAKVRLALEMLTIDLLTVKLVNSRIEELSRLAADCQYFLSIGNRAELFMHDSMFHLELVKCTNNEALYSMYERLDSKVHLLRISKNFSDDVLSKILHQHILLLQALKSNDIASCREIMTMHVKHII